MRIRKPFAGAFAGLVLASAYLGLAPRVLEVPDSAYIQGDKILHFLTFFALTLAFYWIIDTSRRKVLHLTLAVCTTGLACGSEVAQGLLPNGRDFDLYDIAANVLGSGAAVALCSWYHNRMLERKRAARFGGSGLDGDEEAGLTGADVELQTGTSRQVSGLTGTAAVDAELDNWDENAEDWGEPDDEPSVAITTKQDAKKQADATNGDATVSSADAKKRAD